MTSATAAVLLYAELLANIRQISVIASLQTPTTSETHAELSQDRRNLSLVHQGIETRLNLPDRVSDAATLQRPAVGRNEISWRLPLPPRNPSKTIADFGDAAVAPWSSDKLSSPTCICCRSCEMVLCPKESIRVWKDLPSANWAEMMDFWHCHKPSDHNKAEDKVKKNDLQTTKAYGANNKFMAEKGVGFVDLTYLLLSQEDCQEIRHESNIDPTLSCESCHANLGKFDPLANGFHIYKWALSITNPSSPSVRSTYPVANFITAHLLSHVSAQAVHKFVLYTPPLPASVTQSVPLPTKCPSPILHIWVFAPYLTTSFSSSSSTHPPPASKPVSKIFYRNIGPSDLEKLLENTSIITAIEEILLPASVMVSLEMTLEESTANLPPSARKFQDWSVGLLERFVEG